MAKWIDKIFRRKREDETAGQQEQQTPQPLRIEGMTQAPLTPEPDDAELAAAALLELQVQEVQSSKFKVLGRAKRQSRLQSATASESTAENLEHGTLNAEGVASDKRERSGNLEPGGAPSAAYYQRLSRQMAERERQARDQATLRTMRFLAWCEQELKKPDLPMEGKGSLRQMEVELYKRIDTVERVGGELKTRWQHCMAQAIVRQLPEESEE